MADNEKKIEPQKSISNPHDELIADLTSKASKIRTEWNTNSDHPKSIEAHQIADLLEKAVVALTQKK